MECRIWNTKLVPMTQKDWVRNFQENNMIIVKDSNGNVLSDGDSVQIIKDLKVKGASDTLKRGTIIKNIRLGSGEEAVEGNSDKIKGLRLKQCFVKKV